MQRRASRSPISDEYAQYIREHPKEKSKAQRSNKFIRGRYERQRGIARLPYCYLEVVMDEDDSEKEDERVQACEVFVGEGGKDVGMIEMQVLVAAEEVSLGKEE